MRERTRPHLSYKAHICETVRRPSDCSIKNRLGQQRQLFAVRAFSMKVPTRHTDRRAGPKIRYPAINHMLIIWLLCVPFWINDIPQGAFFKIIVISLITLSTKLFDIIAVRAFMNSAELSCMEHILPVVPGKRNRFSRRTDHLLWLQDHSLHSPRWLYHPLFTLSSIYF